MNTLHSVRGATAGLSVGYKDMFAVVGSYVEAYCLDVPEYHISSLSDDIAKIKAICDTKDMVICSTSKMLGPVGVTIAGGIKKAFSEDVYSTIEQRQEVKDMPDMVLAQHLTPSKEGYWAYPEYWVCGKVMSVWVDSKEVSKEYISALSQLCGLILGLLLEVK